MVVLVSAAQKKYTAKGKKKYIDEKKSLVLSHYSFSTQIAW